MVDLRVSRRFPVSTDRLFEVVEAVELLPTAHPEIVSIEFSSTSHRGLGARFRETRRVGRREMTTDLEITEHVPGRCVRMVTSGGGIAWDSLFSVAPEGEGARLEIHMVSRGEGALKGLLFRAFSGPMRRGMETHLDAIGRSLQGAG